MSMHKLKVYSIIKNEAYLFTLVLAIGNMKFSLIVPIQKPQAFIISFIK